MALSQANYALQKNRSKRNEVAHPIGDILSLFEASLESLPRQPMDRRRDKAVMLFTVLMCLEVVQTNKLLIPAALLQQSGSGASKNGRPNTKAISNNAPIHRVYDFSKLHEDANKLTVPKPIIDSHKRKLKEMMEKLKIEIPPSWMLTQ